MKRSFGLLTRVIPQMYGGMHVNLFKFLCESSSAYIRDVLSLRIDHVEPGKLTISLPYKPSFAGNPTTKVYHGGVTAALIDHTGGFCAWTAIDSGHKLLSTVDLRIDYLRPAPCEQDLHCDAVIVHSSSRLVRTDIIVWDQARTHKLAIGRGLYNIYEAPGSKSGKSHADTLRSLFKNYPSIMGALLNGYVAYARYSANKQHERRQQSQSLLAKKESKPIFDSNLQFSGIDMTEFKKRAELNSTYVREVMSLQIESVAPGRITMALPYKPCFTGNPLTKCLHGGVTASLMDHCGGFGAWTVLTKPSHRVSTVDLRVDYLSPAPCRETIYCDAVVSHRGGKLIRTDMTVWNQARTKKIAIGKGLYNIYDMAYATATSSHQVATEEAADCHKSAVSTSSSSSTQHTAVPSLISAVQSH